MRGPGSVDGGYVLLGARGTIRAQRRRDGRAAGSLVLVSGRMRFRGRVTCLEVAPRAVVGIRGVMRRPEHRGPEPRSGVLTLVDGPGTADTVFYDLPAGRAVPDCPAASFTRQAPVSGTLAIRPPSAIPQ